MRGSSNDGGKLFQIGFETSDSQPRATNAEDGRQRTSERESVFALILFGIGDRRGSQQAQSNRASLDGVSVLAIVQQRDSVTELGHVAEPVRDRFKLGSIPCRVAMNRSLSEAELVLKDTAGRESRVSFGSRSEVSNELTPCLPWE